MTTKLCELNSFHSQKERKKETRSDQQNGLPQSLKVVQICLACRASEVWKNGSMSIVRSAICRSGGTGFATYANFGQSEPV